MSHASNLDQVFEALSDPRRRQLCGYLESRREPIDTAAVVSHLRGDPSSATARPSISRRRLETELHHVHLPLLDDAKIIDYTPATARIEPDRNFCVVETILESVADDCDETVT